MAPCNFKKGIYTSNLTSYSTCNVFLAYLENSIIKYLLLIKPWRMSNYGNRRTCIAIELHLETAEIVACYKSMSTNSLRLTCICFQQPVHCCSTFTCQKSHKVYYNGTIHVEHTTTHQVITHPVIFVSEKKTCTIYK